MGRKPGYIVKFTDSEGIQHNGRTYKDIPPVNGKVVVFYLDKDFRDVYEEVKGKRVQKKRLFDHTRLKIQGFAD